MLVLNRTLMLQAGGLSYEVHSVQFVRKQLQLNVSGECLLNSYFRFDISPMYSADNAKTDEK